MIKVERELGDFEQIEIHTFADEHIGDALCDMQRLTERIEYVKNTPNAYAILNGDILDTATRLSIGDIETRELNIMEQIQRGIDLFNPIKDKILCITAGNHELRVYNKEGIDIMRLVALQLGISECYSEGSVLLFLDFGLKSRRKAEKRKMKYMIYCTHGRGGGKREGAKAIRLADMASIIDADVYIHSHTHLPMIIKEAYYRTFPSTNAIVPVTRLFVNTASNLNYGGYGEQAEFKPNSKDTPIIFLSGRNRQMNARL